MPERRREWRKLWDMTYRQWELVDTAAHRAWLEVYRLEAEQKNGGGPGPTILQVKTAEILQDRQALLHAQLTLLMEHIPVDASLVVKCESEAKDR